MSVEFEIEGRAIGERHPTYFIADIGANHDGRIERALDLIQLAAEAGADAAKFQNFHADRIVSQRGFERLGNMAHQAAWTKSVYQTYEDAQIAEEWTTVLRAACTRAGIAYFTSPYDVESVDLVDPFVGAYKIGSGDITFDDLLRYVARKGKPLLLATGASTFEDVARAVGVLRGAAPGGTPLCVMQCNTNYTGDKDNFNYVNLNVLKTYAAAFPDALLGLSDHTPGPATALGAVALGARVIEKHFTDDNARVGPDHGFAMTPASWREMVDRTRELERALGGEDKVVEANERESAIVQRRALYAARRIVAGEVIDAAAIAALRPCPAGAIPPSARHALEGSRAHRDYEIGDRFSFDDWPQNGRP